MADLIIPEKIISRVVGRAVPKPEDNQNTDAMVYGAALNEISFRGYGKKLFEKERFRNRVPVPDHPLNDSRFAGATILIGGENYACGSSREHAAQAHLDAGFKAIVAAGYAGIFRGNCNSIGVVAVTVERNCIKELAELVELTPSLELTINLEDMTLGYRIEGAQYFKSVAMPENARQDFLRGTWDKFLLARQNQEAVKAKMTEIPYFSFQ
jgi:3-isopropylmalate/(R)-2-methylmalate dehydratase small subunit